MFRKDSFTKKTIKQKLRWVSWSNVLDLASILGIFFFMAWKLSDVEWVMTNAARLELIAGATAFCMLAGPVLGRRGGLAVIALFATMSFVIGYAAFWGQRAAWERGLTDAVAYFLAENSVEACETKFFHVSRAGGKTVVQIVDKAFVASRGEDGSVLLERNGTPSLVITPEGGVEDAVKK